MRQETFQLLCINLLAFWYVGVRQAACETLRGMCFCVFTLTCAGASALIPSEDLFMSLVSSRHRLP